MSNKDNAVALITGASSGIGRVTVKALQRVGYHVLKKSHLILHVGRDRIQTVEGSKQ